MSLSDRHFFLLFDIHLLVGHGKLTRCTATHNGLELGNTLLIFTMTVQQNGSAVITHTQRTYAQPCVRHTCVQMTRDPHGKNIPIFC